MRQKDVNPSDDPTIMGNDRPRQDDGAPEGKESGAQQEAPHSKPAGPGDRPVKGPRPEDRDLATHGPEDRHGEERETL